MILRIFVGEECEICNSLKTNLTLLGVKFVLVDAFAEETQQMCDYHDVKELPHVQVLSNDGIVIWQKTGNVPLTTILSKLQNDTHRTFDSK